MKDDELQVIIKEQNIAQDNAKQLIEAFGAPFTEAGVILSTYKDIQVTDEDQTDLMAEARDKRLILKKIRTTVENKRKDLKEDSLRIGKAIDGVAKYIRDNIEPAEQYLELQEKFAEVKKAERLRKIVTERKDKLSPLCENPNVYTLDTMTDSEFDKLYKELKDASDLRAAQEKAYEEQQERARLDKEAEDARVREENELLKKQAAAREAEIAKEREEQRIIHEAELKAEQDRLEQERLKREAIEKENADKIAREEAERQKAQEDEKAQLLAPDKQKLLNFSDALAIIKKEKLPAVKSNEAQKIVNLIEEMLDKMQAVIKDKVKEL